jgi:predicted acetyltransferase
MDIEIRATNPDEARTASNTVSDALIFPRMDDEAWAARQIGWTDHHSLSAWDGPACVGHVGAFRVDTTVPGGARLPTSAVTRVGVLPTYTRRGLLTTMMHRLLVEARDEGRVLASLRASEAVIYRRFGFAVAGESAEMTLTTRTAGPVESPAPGTFRILHESEVLDIVPGLYDRFARRRVGTIDRPHVFWTRILEDAITRKKPSFVAVHLDPSGAIDGYVHYDVQWKHQPDGSEVGAGELNDLFGADAAVERALWAYLLRVDLIQTWTADNRPSEDTIRFAIRDQRAFSSRARWDEQWLRVLDVDAALSGRTYRRGSGAVTIGVTDPLFADNNGTWTVRADGSSRADVPADLAVDIATLSAAYLGGVSWRDLHDAGQVTEHRPGAIDDADTLFAVRPLPFCGTFF